MARDCTETVVCTIGGCRRKHHSLLHADNRSIADKEDVEGFKTKEKVNKRNRTLISSPGQSVVFQTVPAVLKAGKRSLVANALLDPCSDASYVIETAASELCAAGEDCVLNLTTVRGQEAVNMKKVSLSVEGTDGQFRADISALVTKDLSGTSEVIEWGTLKASPE